MKAHWILRTLCPIMLALMICACNREKRTDRYTVIERTNSDAELVLSVPIVLQHDGHKYYAQCNDIKGVEDPKVTIHCNLHVGMTVDCQLFENRHVNGYDLICGSKRDEKGDLATFGENELLQIDKEEK
jgi:hypothetical protein